LRLPELLGVVTGGSSDVKAFAMEWWGLMSLKLAVLLILRLGLLLCWIHRRRQALAATSDSKGMLRSQGWRHSGIPPEFAVLGRTVLAWILVPIERIER